jgi:membrane protease YdiL (CAAX protease family)
MRAPRVIGWLFATVGTEDAGDDTPGSSAGPGLPGAPAPTADPPVDHRTLVQEIWLVLALSLGTSAVYAVLDLIRYLSAGRPLRTQTAVLNSSVVNSSLLNLTYQLVGIAVALVPVALVAYLLKRSHESLGDLGLDLAHPGRETTWGVALATGVGGAGLLLYLGAYHAGLDVRVVPTTLPGTWWRIPVLVLAAAQNGALEEVVVCGYLLHRLRQLSWSDNRALVLSALLRGSYHLFQGFGGFLGNAAMGLLFGRLYQRQRRLPRLILAHTLIDAGAFVGYVTLRSHVSWIP